MQAILLLLESIVSKNTYMGTTSASVLVQLQLLLSQTSTSGCETREGEHHLGLPGAPRSVCQRLFLCGVPCLSPHIDDSSSFLLLPDPPVLSHGSLHLPYLLRNGCFLCHPKPPSHQDPHTAVSSVVPARSPHRPCARVLCVLWSKAQDHLHLLGWM